MRAIVIALALGALTGGCTAIRLYEGDERPREERERNVVAEPSQQTIPIVELGLAA